MQKSKKPIVLEANRYRNEMVPGPKSMPFLTLWVPSACNQNCDYCATEGYKRDAKPLSRDVLLDVIRQAKKLNVKEVSINGSGEPLLYPGIDDIIKQIHKDGISLRITTNGTAITPELARMLFENEVSLLIKLHSVWRPEIHDTLVSKKGSAELIMKGIMNLFAAGFPNKKEDKDFRYSQMGIMTLLADPCFKDIEDVLIYCALSQLYPMIDDIVVAGRMDIKKYKEYALSDDKRRQVARMYEKVMGYPPTTDTLDICAIDTGGIFIGRDGRYYSDAKGSCCDALADTDFGDVRNRSLSSVWGEILELRERYKSHQDEEFQRYRKEKSNFSCYGMWKSQTMAGAR